MTPEHPWVDATIDSFPKGDPKNARRRELLLEATTAVPPDWDGTSRNTPPPSIRPSPRRHLAIDLILLTALGLLLWNLCASPSAHYRLRGIALTGQLFRSLSETDLSGPLGSLVDVTSYGGTDPIPQQIEDDLRQRIPAEKHAECLGQRGATTLTQRWCHYWETHPDDLPIMIEKACIIAAQSGPPDQNFRETTQTLDPGNPYPHLLTLTGATTYCLSEIRYSRRKPAPVPSFDWSIDDPELYGSLWKTLDEALLLHPLETYIEPIVRRRLSGWPTPTDYPDLTRDVIWENNYLSAPSFRFTHDVIKLFSVRAERLEHAGDVDGMEALCDQWRAYLALLNSSHRSQGYAWIASSSFCRTGSKPLQEACASLGMTAEEAFFSAASVPASSVHSKFSSYWGSMKGSSLNWMHSHGYSSDPQPGILAEHRMFEGLYLTGTFLLVLGFILVFSIAGLIVRKRTLGLTLPLGSLLTIRDHTRIFAIGAGIPFLVLLLCLEVPLLNTRSKSIDSTSAVATLLKLSAFSVGSLFLTSWETLRALARRARPIGFSTTTSRPILLLGLLALSVAPAASTLVHLDSGPISEQREWIWIGLFSMLGLELLAFLAGVVVFLSSGARRIQMATSLRQLNRHLVLVAIVLATMVPGFRVIESHHVSMAHPERIDTPEAIDIALGESPLDKEARQIFLDYLDTAPKD